jgi:hypothetical protein
MWDGKYTEKTGETGISREFARCLPSGFGVASKAARRQTCDAYRELRKSVDPRHQISEQPTGVLAIPFGRHLEPERKAQVSQAIPPLERPDDDTLTPCNASSPEFVEP